jgi:hypothetical protein
MQHKKVSAELLIHLDALVIKGKATWAVNIKLKLQKDIEESLGFLKVNFVLSFMQNGLADLQSKAYKTSK